MTQSIRIYETGPANFMKFETTPMPRALPHEVVVQHKAIGINFIDIYFRTGFYKTDLPFTPGLEAAGVIIECGAQVKNYKVGDAVAYSTFPLGAYATERAIPADCLVKLPEFMDAKAAAALMLKGLTSWYLLHKTYSVSAKDTVVITAAAGGVGLILCAWARAKGAHVIAATSSAQKAELLKKQGVEHIIVGYDNLQPQVLEYTNGHLADVVYDGIGHKTFLSCLDCLRPKGLMVTYGSASGPVAPFAPSLLNERGSVFLTSPKLFDYIDTPESLQEGADALFSQVKAGVIHPEIHQTFSLAEAQKAHQLLEAGQTTGSTILLP